jgi:hypothetical protein
MATCVPLLGPERPGQLPDGAFTAAPSSAVRSGQDLNGSDLAGGTSISTRSALVPAAGQSVCGWRADPSGVDGTWKLTPWRGSG